MIMTNLMKLRSRDKYKRGWAALELGASKRPWVARFMMRALRDDEAAVREKVVRGLGKLGGPRARRAILGVLQDSDPQVREEAVRTLGEMGRSDCSPQVVAALVGMLSDPEMGVRKAVLYALGSLGDPTAEPAIVQILEGCERELVNAAAFAAARLRSRRACEPLLRALKNLDPQVRSYVAGALGSVGDPRAIGPLVLALADEERKVADEARAALDKIDRGWASSDSAREAVTALESRWSDLCEHWLARFSIVRVLTEIASPRSISFLLETAADPKYEYEAGHVEDAIRKLGLRAVPYLIEALQYGRPELKATAARLLRAEVKTWPSPAPAKYPKEATIRALLGLLKSSHEEDERMQILSVLAELKELRALEPLLALLRSPSCSTAAKAAAVLATHADPRAVEPLIDLLGARDAPREEIVAALGTLRDARAVEPLLNLLADAEAPRPAALLALARIGDKRAAEVVIDDLLLVPARPVDPSRPGSRRVREDYEPLLEDYSELVLSVGSIEEPTCRCYGSPAPDRFYDYTVNTAAVDRLCRLDTPISTNLLARIAEMPDSEKVLLEKYAIGEIWEPLSFEPARVMARRELEKRGVSYNRLAYLNPSSWKIAGTK